MFSAFTKAFISLFNLKPPRTMSDGEKLVLDPTCCQTVDTFFYIISSWAARSSEPERILDRFKVVCVMHNKNPTPPEHEYLIIKTVDQEENDKVRFFILECTISNGQNAVFVTEDDRDKKMKDTLGQFKRLATTAVSTLGSSEAHMASMEEGSASSERSLKDEMSLAIIQSTDLVSDSINKTVKVPAVDRILGGNGIGSKEYHGLNVQYFKPNRLTLFELVLLAKVIHEKNPLYSLLYSQCYFYAGLVYAAAESYAQVLISENADKTQKDLIYIRGSHLSDKYGRWKGVKVFRIDPHSEEVHNLIYSFKENLRDEIHKVCNKHLNITSYNILHRLV
jgi:hypothetical protein